VIATTTWYRIRWEQITPVQVERSTQTSIWMDGHRESRASNYTSYFPSWEEARNYLLDKTEREAASLKAQLTRKEGLLGNLRGMKEPVNGTEKHT
jgi:hypothetical protein